MLYLGIDLGGTNIAIGLVDDKGKLISKDSIPTNKDRDYTEIVKDMADLSIYIIKRNSYELKDIKSIGIGCPGTIDSEKGIVIYSNNIKFNNVPIRSEMQKYIDLPVFIENDANCAALAESVSGAAKGTTNSVTITLGTGIGSGVIIDNKIYSGFNNAASELGHTTLILGGKECTCGRGGCWEAYASATALIRATQDALRENSNSVINKMIKGDMEKIDAKIPFDAAKQGDKIGSMLIDKYIEYLSAGLTNVINAFQPEVLVIGGGVCNQGEYLLEPVNKLVKQNMFCKEVRQTEIKVAKLGNDAGIVGAAMLGK